MIRRPSLPLVFIVLFVCFVAGVASVLFRQNDDQHPSASPQPSAISPGLMPVANATSSPQTTILILGVDQLGSPSPKLEAIWFATFRLPGTALFFFGIPLDARVGSQEGPQLKDLFRWSADQGPDAFFMQSLYAKVPLSLDVVLVVDRTAFATLIDYMGGVALESGTLDGNQVIGVLELVEDQPQASLEVQERLIRGLSEKAPNLGSTPDLTPLMDLIPEHAYSSIPAINVVAMISPLLPLRSASIHVQLMPGN